MLNLFATTSQGATQAYNVWSFPVLLVLIEKLFHPSSSGQIYSEVAKSESLSELQGTP